MRDEDRRERRENPKFADCRLLDSATIGGLDALQVCDLYLRKSSSSLSVLIRSMVCYQRAIGFKVTSILRQRVIDGGHLEEVAGSETFLELLGKKERSRNLIPRATPSVFNEFNDDTIKINVRAVV